MTGRITDREAFSIGCCPAALETDLLTGYQLTDYKWHYYYYW